MSIEIHFERFMHPGIDPYCTIFQAAAHDTWARIAFSRGTPGLKIHETTITQNLVYELNLLKSRMALRGLTFFESLDERTNGHDLEIVIRQPVGWVTYWVQSKILYHSFRRNKHITLDDGVYRQLPHRSGGENQIDNLLRRTRTKGYIPLYLLYNFVTAPIATRRLCHLEVEQSQYGCTLVGAPFLKDHYSREDGHLRSDVQFSDLHPEVALPWLALVCCLPSTSLAETRRLFKLPPNYPIRPAETEPETNQQRWSYLTEYVLTERSYRISNQKVIGFAPRYRILIDPLQNR